MIVRYDLQSDSRAIHPERAFEFDEIKVIKAEASSYGDCWFLEIEGKENLPKWYTVLENFEFTKPDQKFTTDL